MEVDWDDREARPTAGPERLEDRVPRNARQRRLPADRCDGHWPAARRPGELGHQTGRHLEGDSLWLGGGDHIAHGAAIHRVVVAGRHSQQVPEALDEGRLSIGLLQDLRGRPLERASTPPTSSFCAYWASDSMSRVLSWRPRFTRALSSLNTPASRRWSRPGHFSRGFSPGAPRVD